MFYDLNIPWTTAQADLQRTLAFSAELGYNVVALNHCITGKLPADLTSPIPIPLPFPSPESLKLLTRCTLTILDTSTNHRLAVLTQNYSIVAIRPTDEKTFLFACQSLDCDLISLDLSARFLFHFKQKTVSTALQRGIKLEMCYAPGILNSGGDGAMARRNLIQNATEIIRATRGRGLVISSEAKRALACRAPWDVINLAAVWGLGQERGLEAISREARSAVVQAEMKRRSFRGVIDVIYGGEKPEMMEKEAPAGKPKQKKRKADAVADGDAINKEIEKPISKREQKRRAKNARLEEPKSIVKESGFLTTGPDEKAPKAQTS